MNLNQIVEDIDSMSDVIYKYDLEHPNQSEPDRNGDYEKYLIKIHKKEPDLSQAEESSLIHPEGLQYYYNSTVGRFIVDVPGIVYFYNWETFNPMIVGWAPIKNFNSANQGWLFTRLIETEAIKELNKQLKEAIEETENRPSIKEQERRRQSRIERLSRSKKYETKSDISFQPPKKKSNSLEEVISTKSKLSHLGILSSSSIKDNLIANAIDYELTDLRKRLEKISRKNDYDDSSSEEQKPDEQLREIIPTDGKFIEELVDL